MQEKVNDRKKSIEKNQPKSREEMRFEAALSALNGILANPSTRIHGMSNSDFRAFRVDLVFKAVTFANDFIAAINKEDF